MKAPKDQIAEIETEERQKDFNTDMMEGAI